MLGLLFLFCFGLIGCADNPGAETEGPGQEAEEETEADDQLYILLYADEEKDHIFVESVDTGRQGEFEWNGDTAIYNREGGEIRLKDLTTGELVELQFTEDEVLTEITVSSKTFEYDGITDFSIDEEEGILTAGDSNYYFDEHLKIFSGKGIISVNELSREDTLCIRGLDRKALTVVVTRGHGTVVFRNTGDFEGGMLTLGDMKPQKITDDMVLEVPEGTYTLSVETDEYSGTMEITVNRFEELTVDLNVIKDEKNISYYRRKRYGLS